jgi:UDP-N-acetylmuramyl pentapeptide synthase
MKIDILEMILSQEILKIYNKKKKKIYTFHSFFWIAQNNIHRNNIFIAIKGQNTDGNLFIPLAIQNGYKYIMSDNEETLQNYINKYEDIIFFLVKNIHNALDLLATWGLSQFSGLKFAITGSSGKTTTAYILQNLLKIYGKVICTSKYNTQYFLKQLYFDLHKKKIDFLVLEFSSDSAGTIHALSNILKPDYSIITSISQAHLEQFTCENIIIKEKTSIVHNTRYQTYIPKSYQDKTMTYIKSVDQVKYIPDNFETHLDQIFFKNPHGEIICTIGESQLKGVHNYNNMNLVLNLLNDLKYLFYKKKQVINTLQNLNCFPGRGNIIFIKNQDYNFKITCEQHNCNPDSFAKTILNIMEPTLLIMGFMAGLGDIHLNAHEKIFQLLESNPYIIHIIIGDQKLYTLPFLSKITKILPEELCTNNYLLLLKKYHITNILVKGSRVSCLERKIEQILNNI